MKIQSLTLDNGLSIVGIPMKSVPATTIMIMVNTGTRFEQKNNNGISHFLEHMFFKGTENRPSSKQVATDLDALGAESNAFTWYEFTAYYGKVQPAKTKSMLSILADIYKNPLFPEEEIASEAGVIAEEIQMYEDMPARRVHDSFHELVFKDHSLGLPILGTEENIKQFSQKNFFNYRDYHYAPQKTVVVIAGGVDNKLMDDVTNEFKPLSKNDVITADPVRLNNKQVFKHDSEDTDQTHIVVGSPTVERTNEKRPTLDILTTLVGKGRSSRLFQTLREDMGVCYSVNAATSYFTDIGLFRMSAGVSNSRVTESITAMKSVLEAIVTDGISDQELRKAKEHRIGKYLISHESTNKIAREFAIQAVLDPNLEPPEEYVDRLRSVSKEDVIKAAQDLLSNGLQAAIIGPDVNGEEVKEILRTE